MTGEVIPNGYYHSVLFVCVLLWQLKEVMTGQVIPNFH